MTCDSELFRVDTMTADGEVIDIEDSTVTIEGAAGFETEAVLGATGNDATTRKRVARVIKGKLFFKLGTTPEKFSKWCNVQVVLSNLHTGQRVRAGKCRFASLGEIGGGSVDFSLNVLQPLQWL